LNSWTKRLEVAINLSILCAFLMVAALAAQRLLNKRSTSHPSIGAKITVTGIDWSKSKQNLVLALSTTCHFCSESADFYKRLVPDATRHGINVVAVLPQPPNSSRSYLNGLGVSVPEIFQSSLGSIDVTGTPTLLVVDAKGKILKAWIGKISGAQEEEVLEALR
jgi:peroxiredoxin